MNSRWRPPPFWVLISYFVILSSAFILLILCYLNRACCEVPASQISSRSDDIWPSDNDLSKFKTAAAAILVFDFVLPVLILLDRACSDVPACQLSSRSDDIWASYGNLSEFKMAATPSCFF